MVKEIVEKNKSMDYQDNKLEKLKAIFPNCFTKNGQVDFKLLEEELNSNVDIIKEGYSLNFLGKQYAKMLSSLDTETIVVPDNENNKKVENINSENIYISGDNLDVLKHLVKSYTNKIKCIYIDPPYNTGSDGFVYNDKFTFNANELKEKLDISEEESQRILNMTNSKSSSHSAWLTFMYPRLYVARQLLKDDGVIFISIDQNEESNLHLLCNNIFGEENLLGILPTVMNLKGNNDEFAFSGTHEYTVVYSKNKENCKIHEFDISEEELELWLEDEIGLYKKGANLKSTGGNAPREKRPNLYFPLYISEKSNYCSVYRKSETDIEVFPLTNGIEMSWRWGKEKFQKQCDDIIISNDNNEISIYKKQRPSLGELPTTKPKSIFYKPYYSSGNGTNRIKKLFGDKVFKNPKPIELIYDFLQLVMDDGDIILDFFAGSGSTADSVMKFNSSKNLKISYILVQINEDLENNLQTAKIDDKELLQKMINCLQNVQKPLFLDEIGQERIRRAAKKIKEETNADIDYGFKHYTVKDLSSKTLDKLENFEPNYFISDQTILDEFGIDSVLTTWINQDGKGITDKYEKINLDGYTAYKVDNIIYLLNKGLKVSSIKSLIDLYANENNFNCDRIVMFGYSFALQEIQTLKDNLKQVKNIKDLSVDLITRY